MGTGCTPSRNQVSLFALPDQAGGCVSLSTGNYGGFDVAGLPNDWVSSLKVGTAVTATLYLDANFGTPSYDYAPNDAKNVCDSIDFDGRPELSSIKIFDLPSTPGTATLQVAQVAASGSAVVGSLAGGTPNKSYTLAFYAGSSCSDDRTPGATLLGTTAVSTDANGNASFALLVDGLPALPAKISVTALLAGYSPTSPAVPACVTATPRDDNTAWTRARLLDVSSGTASVGDEAINLPASRVGTSSTSRRAARFRSTFRTCRRTTTSRSSPTSGSRTTTSPPRAACSR